MFGKAAIRQLETEKRALEAKLLLLEAKNIQLEAISSFSYDEYMVTIDLNSNIIASNLAFDSLQNQDKIISELRKNNSSIKVDECEGEVKFQTITNATVYRFKKEDVRHD